MVLVLILHFHMKKSLLSFVPTEITFSKAKLRQVSNKKMILDLDILLKSREKNIIPKFLRFKVAKRQLQKRS